MKIIHFSSGNVWGGSECYIFDLCKRQIEDGHDVEIISADRPEIVNIFRQHGFKVTIMQMHGHMNITPLRLAAKLRLSRQNTVIHVHKSSDAFLAQKARFLAGNPDHVKIVSTTHIIEPAVTDNKHNKMYGRMDAMIFISKISMNAFLSSSPRIDRQKIHLVYNSIVPVSITPSDKALDRTNKIEVLYAGRLIAEKGVDTLLEAIALVPGVMLKICGTGEDAYVSSLKAMADKLGISERTEWCGFRPNIFESIANADIGVVPSRWAEPFGLIILEFMSLKVPVVTTDNGAQPEIITNGVNGLLVKPDDPIALSQAIKTLADDATLRRKLGAAGLNTYKSRFTYEEFYRQITEVYHAAFGVKDTCLRS